MILVLLIGATGLKIIQHSRTIPKIEWILFGVAIVAVHPDPAYQRRSGCAPSADVYRGECMAFDRDQIRSIAIVRRWNRLRWQQALQNATIAVVIGISCIMLANASLRALCYAANIPYHSVVGFAFLGRLKFLAALPIQQRNQLLDQATKNTVSADVKSVISVLRNEFTSGIANWDLGAFNKKRTSLVLSASRDPRRAAEIR